MKATEHPSMWFDLSVLESISQNAWAAESLRQLHPDQLEIIYKEGWLKMFVPKKLGGLGLSIPEVLKMEEALAWTDGSTAWVVTLCAGAGWFVGFLDHEVAKEALSNDHVCFAGSGATTGTAEIIPEGYVLNGNWRYASGALHATVFTANCVLHKNGRPLLDQNGDQVVHAFLMKRDEVTLYKTWNSIGMIATGSHSFEVKNLKVPSNRCFQIDPTKTMIDDPIFKYPFLQLAETTLAVNLSGLAVRFIDLAEVILIQKSNNGKNPRSIKVLQEAKAKLNEHRAQFHKAADQSWRSCLKNKVIPKAELTKVSKTSQRLARQSVQAVDLIYPFCGLMAADTSQEINRVWRNIHTASQHSLFTR